LDNSTPRNYLSKVKYTNNHIPLNGKTNKAVLNQTYVDALDETSIDNETFFNQNQQEGFIIKTGSNLTRPDNLSDNIWSTTVSNFSVRNTTGPFLSHCYYTSLKKYNPRMYGSLANIIYYETHPCVIDKSNTVAYSNDPLYGGDTFISILWIRKTFEGNEGSECGESDSNKRYDERALFGAWMESTINSELRNEGDLTVDTELDVTDRCNEGYYPKTFADPNEIYIQEGKTRDYLDRNSTCINSYLYNDDYSKENEIILHLPLPITFDFCTKCLNQFKTRLAVSQTSFQEESIDNYRAFLANNYKDIPAEKGEITNLLNKNNKLYIHTENSLFYQDIKPQQIRSDQAILYVATGEVLEQPVQEVSTSDNGYAGSINRIATINTPYGIFYISERDRKVFRFTNQLDEISNVGISNWLQNNMTIKYVEQIKEKLNIDISPDNPANPTGVGYVAAFDSLNDRIIISKKDYLFLHIDDVKGTTDSTLNNLGYYDLNGVLQFQADGDIYFDIDNNYFFRRNSSTSKTLFALNNNQNFENLSWTLTYHIKSNAWASWHSYLPSHLFSTQKRVFSHIASQSEPIIYEHNVGNYLQYYRDLYKPFIVETNLTKNQLQTVTYPTISFLTDVIQHNSFTKQDIYFDETFNKVWLYNDYQSTGILDIVNKDNSPYASILPLNNTTIHVDRNERVWSINDYRNVIEQTDPPQSLTVADWQSILADYYIDKIPNPAIHNPAKSIYNVDRQRNTYLSLRFIYENQDNKLIRYKFNIPSTSISKR
jgi:hypothetical protein